MWSSVGSPGWGTTTYRAASGSWSAYCAGNSTSAPGPYANNMNAWLMAGPFDLSAATSGALMFKVWANTEMDYDLVKGMVSVDGTNFYGWSGSGNTLGWTDVSLDLNAVPTLGNVCGRSQVWVAFIFRSDASNTSEGAYVDNVALLASSPPPTISGFSPASGSAGTQVTLTGSSFVGATGVKFNGIPASFKVDSSTQITATVPTNSTSGMITVTTPSGTAASAQSFTVLRPPSISRFSPSSGPSYTRVGLTGAGFTGATAVRFNGVPAKFEISSDQHISATVPSGASSGPITVTTPFGTATSTEAFTFIPHPEITGWTPRWGPVGSSVLVTGSGFTGASVVSFGDSAAVFSVIGDGQLTATVPVGATSSPISITTPGGREVVFGLFIVAATTPAPQMSNFIPAWGPVGSKVTLTGFCLTGAMSVKFGGVAAVFSVVSDEEITATVPARAMSGPITVTTPAGTGKVSTFNVSKPRPKIGTPICPASVKHGTTFKVYGGLRPRFPARSKTVKVRVWRYSGGHWSPIKTVAAVNSNYSRYTRYTVKLRFSSRGKYRFQAYTRETPIWGANGSRDSRRLTVR